jgi:hypothetical protein
MLGKDGIKVAVLRNAFECDVRNGLVLEAS